jgi:proteasome lid subunit RPN8/RPN11
MERLQESPADPAGLIDGLTSVGLIDVEKYRWAHGESMARAERFEVVGLGFESDGRIIYHQLQNVAPLRRRDRMFEVEGTHLRNVVEHVGQQPVVLWHSHTVSVEPSETDVETFPSWLVNTGVIYHSPSDSMTLYNESGVIYT